MNNMSLKRLRKIELLVTGILVIIALIKIMFGG
jgi:hypothetical protein